MAQSKDSTAYIMDTYRERDSKAYCPGAIMFRGRKKMQALRWEKRFSTLAEADTFVRDKLAGMSLKEAGNEGELR